jgi:DNA-binding NarL/FixJ family response regulator
MQNETRNRKIKMSIAISIVEDQHDMRESLVEWLGHAPGLRCVGAHATAEEALRDIPAENPDVVLMDINLTGMNGIQCVARLKERLPKTQVLMLTTYDEGDLIFDSLRAGANGYLLKNMPQEKLVEAVRQVHAGGAPMSLQIARKVINHFHRAKKPASELEHLTPREYEILQLLAKGYMYKEIADRLTISMSTIRTHISAIYEKLHVHSRTEAAMKFAGRE